MHRAGSVPEWKQEVFNAWKAGLPYRSIVKVPARVPLEQETAEEQEERRQKELCRADALAAAFRAGVLGDSLWTQNAVPSGPEELALAYSLGEAQALNASPEQ